MAARELLGAGADPNLHAQVSAFSNGQNALHAAAQRGHLELVRLLLASGARLKTKEIEWSPDNRGKTALELAVENCHRAVVEELVAAFGRELPRLKTGTGLHEAAETGQDSLIRFLLSKGVQVDVLLKRSTPLMSAAGYGFPECVKTLLEAGANVNYLTKNGHSPLSAAIYGAYLSPKASTDENVMEQWVKTVQVLLKHGANVNVITWQKNTPLFMADTYNLKKIAEVLREFGGKHADDLQRITPKD